MSKAAEFLYETGMLAKQYRTGWAFLGASQQSIAEHTNRVCFVGYILAQMHGNIDSGKVVSMCLFHDLPEARSLDHHYVSQQYVTVDEEQISHDQLLGLPGESYTKELVYEYRKRESIESRLAKDADILEAILTIRAQKNSCEKELTDEWIRVLTPHIKSEVGNQLLQEILTTPATDWRRNMANQKAMDKIAHS